MPFFCCALLQRCHVSGQEPSPSALFTGLGAGSPAKSANPHVPSVCEPAVAFDVAHRHPDLWQIDCAGHGRRCSCDLDPPPQTLQTPIPIGPKGGGFMSGGGGGMSGGVCMPVRIPTPFVLWMPRVPNNDVVSPGCTPKDCVVYPLCIPKAMAPATVHKAPKFAGAAFVRNPPPPAPAPQVLPSRTPPPLRCPRQTSVAAFFAEARGSGQSPFHTLSVLRADVPAPSVGRWPLAVDGAGLCADTRACSCFGGVVHL